MMADVLENLLTGHVLLDDFKMWLISDSVGNCNEKADFILYFLNYIKDKSAWLISKDGKGLDSPTIKLKSREISNCNVNYEVPVNRKIVPKTSPEFTERNKSDVKYFQSNRQNRVNHHEERVKSGSRAQIFNENPKIACNEKGLKLQGSAKKNLNFMSMKDTKVIVHGNNNIPKFEENIRSLDAFPPLDQKSNNIKPHDSKIRRRITPTPVQMINKGSSKFGSSKFAVSTESISNDVFKKTPFKENPSFDFQNEREMLKMERNKFSQSAVLSTNFNDSKSENSITTMKCTPVPYIIPNLQKVSHKSQLEVFSFIYDFLIMNALVPNVTSELYFIFELLTAKVSEDSPDNESNQFCSVHNCTFFGVTVLSKLPQLINLLDKNTLFSLCEVPFLSEFSSDLVNFLQDCSKEKQEIITKSPSLNRVPFLLEEDSKENFIHDRAFASFRKQRDLFYELLRDWQQQSLDSVDSKFQENFSYKVKILISLGPNAINMHHLAKLFQNQLIASCLDLEVNEVYDDLLSNIQKNFPGKFEKLHQRFMMPFCVGEPNPPPTFYGVQSFFSDLIQAASCVTLNQHLQDIFVSKILELNSTDIFSDEELSSLGTVREKYIFLLHRLRLLGKFLGYLYFLPYKISEPLPVSIINNQLSSRKHSAPPIDVLILLKTAVENNRVILTIPWIVEYLSMIDPIAKNLPYVEDTLQILIAVYRGNYIFSHNSLNFWFLRIVIGWLFDVLGYPFKYFYLLQPMSFAKHVKCEGLDFLAIIDKQLIHSCCPYLIEFKVLVDSFLNGIKNDKKREVRKITPLSTTKPQIPTSLVKQQTEIQLEENFFFLHPPSLRKTVEFVSERMASKVINRIRSEITEFKLHSIKYITNQETYKTLCNSKSINKSELKTFIDSCILKLYQESQSKIDDFMNVKCRHDIENIMPCLLADDVKPPVLKMCCKISFHHAVDKITVWCEANLILLDIQKDIENKLNHLSKGDGDMTTKDICSSSLIDTLRQLVIKIRSSYTITDDHINVLTEVPPLLKKEIELSQKKLLVFLTVDLYIALIIHCPQKYDDKCTRNFVNIWSLCPECYNLENYFLGVQNIKFLLAGNHFELSCEQFVLMLSILVNKKIFNVGKLKDYLAKLNSYQWKDTRSSKILCSVSDILKSQ